MLYGNQVTIDTQNMNIKSILLLEDTDDVRTWLSGLVKQAFPGCTVQEATTLSQAKEAIQKQSYDLALLDINLPDGNGIDVLKAILRQNEKTYCVMATIFDDDEYIFRALQEGAHGYLLKSQEDDKLTASLIGILNNEPPLSPPIALRVLNHFRQPPAAQSVTEKNTLSEREREIIILLAKGMSRAEIGRLLQISTTTVATHVGTIYRKLNISSRSEATVEAVRLGLVQV